MHAGKGNDTVRSIARKGDPDRALAALFAPGLTRAEDIRAVCAAVTKPVNVVMGLKGVPLSVAQLADLGVRRISLGGSLCRAAMAGLFAAAREVREKGTFSFAETAVPSAELWPLMAGR